MSKWNKTMKLEELKEYWQCDIQVELKDGGVVKGELVGFERGCDEPSGLDCINVYTEENANVCIFLNEIVQIYERHIIDDRPDNHPEVVKRREKLLNSLSAEEKKNLDDLFQKLMKDK